MSMEIRACRDRDELAAYRDVVAYVFAENDRTLTELEQESTLPEWTTCAFDEGRAIATLGAYPFTVRLNGAPVAMAGVTAVGTYPEYRRQGLLRQIMGQAMATMRDRGQSFAILWASMGAIYQRFGYGLASTNVLYEFDPRYAGFESGAAPTGSISLLPKDDAFPVIKQVYIRYATPRNLLIHRSSTLWQLGVLRPRPKERQVFTAIYRDAGGEPQGYIVYQQEDPPSREPGPTVEMEVRDLVALTMDAYRGLWEFIRRHDLVSKVRISNIGDEDPAPHLLLEPRMLGRRTLDGIWLRVVDVERGLVQRPYGGRGELTFAIESDGMCVWNNGTYLLETDGSTANVRRIDRAPQLTMPPRTLASLVSGHDSATNLHRWGLLQADDDAALGTADRLFATAYRPYCPDGF